MRLWRMRSLRHGDYMRRNDCDSQMYTTNRVNWIIFFTSFIVVGTDSKFFIPNINYTHDQSQFRLCHSEHKSLVTLFSTHYCSYAGATAASHRHRQSSERAVKDCVKCSSMTTTMGDADDSVVSRGYSFIASRTPRSKQASEQALSSHRNQRELIKL